MASGEKPHPAIQPVLPPASVQLAMLSAADRGLHDPSIVPPVTSPKFTWINEFQFQVEEWKLQVRTSRSGWWIVRKLPSMRQSVDPHAVGEPPLCFLD